MTEIMKRGGPAFPVGHNPLVHSIGCAAIQGVEDAAERDRIYTETTAAAAGGMSLRDYFAAKALMGLLAEPISDVQNTASFVSTALKDDQPGDLLARAAYQLADAMLRARGAA